MTDADDSWMGGLDSAAYDDELNAILTSRGWTSDRSWKDEVMFDRWRITFAPDAHGRPQETTIACHDRHEDMYYVEMAGCAEPGVTLKRKALFHMLEKYESHTP